MKVLKWILIVLGALALLFFFVVSPYMRTQTKKHSPEKAAAFVNKDLDLNLSVYYNSPSKKGRTIFGDLVPYDQVWRTGANEPTTFTTITPIRIKDRDLPAGTYSIWTVPGEKSWIVMFNKTIPDWGVSMSFSGMKPSWDKDSDAVRVEVPSANLPQVVENLIIDFELREQLYLTLAWDTTKIGVPISRY